jgi:acyl-homoserine-lactone acylase
MGGSVKRMTALVSATLLVIGAVGTGVAGASGPPSSSPAAGGYEATISRDWRGVPHITAADWGSLGFGQGYALAEDRACTVLDQVVKVRGQRARWLGPGDDDTNVDSDFAYRHLGLWEEAPARWGDQPAHVQDVVDGYVAGFNESLETDGVGANWCAGEPWVGPITTQDLYAYISDVLLLASSRRLIREIGSTQPPASATANSAPDTAPAGFAPGSLRLPSAGASNGWALGADRSTTDGGLLLANPHFPWEGEQRFWESHLTIPGELDVYGVSLTGLPGVQIGFNDAVAWTHTVSAGRRFALYRYDLDPADPTVYLVDGEPQAMAATDITIEVAGADGSTTEVSRTLYRTKHGPVVSVGPLGWTAEQVVAIGDANAAITTVLQQYFGMDTATSMDEFQAVHADFQGVPWVNTIATSADGRAWFIDSSATPNLSPEAIAAWRAEREAGGLMGLAYDQFGVFLLDGSDTLYDWVDDPAAPAPGLIPYDGLAQLERRDYVFNANDSHWLAHPDELLSGFSPLQGAEEVPQTPRTRTNVMLLGESDEPWSIDDVEASIFSDRSVLVELLREPLVEACTAQPVIDVGGAPFDLAKACAVLDAWDGTYALDAAGAMLFREWLSRFEPSDRQDAGALFSDAFDPGDPAGTPSTPVEDRAGWLVNLASAAQLLEFLGVPLDAALRDWQWEIRTGDQIPIHGGTNIDGVANIVDCCAGRSSLGPSAATGDPVNETTTLRSVPDIGIGYPIERGASFVMALQFGPDGPVAEGLLTYGNPDDPNDPAFRAGLDLFSASEWTPLLFDADDVAAATVESTTVSG